MWSLVEWALGWKAAAPAPSAGGKKSKAAQPSGAAKAKAKNQEHERDRVFPRHGRAGRRGMVTSAAATGASTTTSTAPPTQPALPHPPPPQISLDSSNRLNSRSSNHSSNLNSSPSSSSSRRLPPGAGFSSQAWPTSAGQLAAVWDAEVDVEAPTRGSAAPGEVVSETGGGGGGRAGTLIAGTGRSVTPRVAPKPGSVSPALLHGDKERLNRKCSTDSRSEFNSEMPYDVLPQNTTTKSREVRVSDTSHLT